jgi:hypothetical protein
VRRSIFVLPMSTRWQKQRLCEWIGIGDDDRL